jgi:hypothetical protein
MNRDNMKQPAGLEIIELKDFSVLHFLSKPPRIEAQVIFNRDNISQKLLFKIMEITYNHGFGCSPPRFDSPDDPIMTFYVGTIMPTSRSLNKYLNKIYDCLMDIKEFANDFNKQLDFSIVDLSMFSDFNIHEFYPERLAAIRDQNYGGSWKDLHSYLEKAGKFLEADFVKSCQEFEKVNKKDIGLIGHKLSDLIHELEEIDPEPN